MWSKWLEGDPFLIRVNRNDGGADNLHIDGAHWHYDADPSVDVAVLPFHLVTEREHSVRFIDDSKETCARIKIGSRGGGELHD
jgi:hypothetical protein